MVQFEKKSKNLFPRADSNPDRSSGISRNPLRHGCIFHISRSSGRKNSEKNLKISAQAGEFFGEGPIKPKNFPDFIKNKIGFWPIFKKLFKNNYKSYRPKILAVIFFHFGLPLKKFWRQSDVPVKSFLSNCQILWWDLI